MVNPRLRRVRKLPDGRWQVSRTDGACLSLVAEEWIAVMEMMGYSVLETPGWRIYMPNRSPVSSPSSLPVNPSI